MRAPFKLLALTVAIALGSSGCILTRLVDHQFIGATVKRPASPDRLVTGLFLLPFTAVIDLATFPVQALIVAIVGDNFPFGHQPDDSREITGQLQRDPRLQGLTAEQKLVAAQELELLIRSGQMIGHAAALGLDGHWVLVPMNDEARNQALARASAPPPAQLAAR